MTFDTPLTLHGPLRHPRQMLAEQEYGGHTSIHDDATAEKFGIRAGPDRGTDPLQPVPTVAGPKIWGNDVV